VPIKAGASYYDAAWGVDLIVRPDWQQRGVGSVIALEASRDCKVAIGVSVSTQAAKAIQRLGWSDLAMVPIYLRPLQLKRVLGLGISPIIARTAGALPSALLDVIDRSVLGAGLRLPRVELEHIEHFDARADEIWHRCAPHYRVLCRRDRETLEWRFAEHPIKRRYVMYYVKRRRELIGYVVLRYGSWNALPCGYIVDYLSRPKHTPLLLAAALREIRRQGAAIAACNTLSTSSDRAFRMLGFIPRESRCRMMLKTQGIDDIDAGTLHDRNAWFVTAGDSDLDRPRPWEEEV
jgi:hypothetical protein